MKGVSHTLSNCANSSPMRFLLHHAAHRHLCTLPLLLGGLAVVILVPACCGGRATGTAAEAQSAEQSSGPAGRTSSERAHIGSVVPIDDVGIDDV